MYIRSWNKRFMKFHCNCKGFLRGFFLARIVNNLLVNAARQVQHKMLLLKVLDKPIFNLHIKKRLPNIKYFSCDITTYFKSVWSSSGYSGSWSKHCWLKHYLQKKRFINSGFNKTKTILIVEKTKIVL